MKNRIYNKYYFFKNKFTSENIRTMIFCLIILIIIINSIRDKTFSLSSLVDLKLLSSIILLFFSDWIANSINRIIQNKYEDFAKLTNDYNLLVNKYKFSNLVVFKPDSYSLELPYELVLGVNSDDKIVIQDKKEKYYELPKQICNISDYIFDVHKGSIVYNNINIRLDDFQYINNTISLYTSRTHYFDSLITNRACDLELKDGRSIREIFEPGPYIKPFRITKMSNHIGFNGIVRTSDGYIPLIMRSRNVSIAKGVLATSLSASLKTKYAIDKRNHEFTLSGLASAIRNEIFDEIGIDLSSVSAGEIVKCIRYFYRDLVECGKPQFFVYMDLPYSKDYIKEIFYKTNNDNVSKEPESKELLMRKDGKEILFFKDEDFLNAKLVESADDDGKLYRYDKININGIEYDITPGMLLGVEFVRRNIYI